jgi:DNA-binding response OmpR family regulator
MKKILVVDDDPFIAELIGDFCRQLGFEVKLENDSLSVQETAESWNPDLITLDLDMPILDGVGVLERLQNRTQTKRIPVVIVSVMAQNALESGRFNQGVRMVFQKPVPMKRLAERLKALLDTGVPPPGTVPSLTAL